MPRTPTPAPRGVMEVDWPFFGEICRALALKVAREYEPEVVLGIAKAGVIPGAVVASILGVDFASMVVTRKEGDAEPVLVSGPPASIGGPSPTNSASGSIARLLCPYCSICCSASYHPYH